MIGFTLALVMFITLSPGATRVYASSVFGGLRAPGEPALIAGHRGDRANAPENTLPALQGALDSSMEFVETDVQLTADRVPVLIHDTTLDRTTNGTGPVSDITFAHLRKLDAGRWYAKRFAATRVPSLDEFFTIFADSPTKKVLLELKGFWEKDDVTLVVDLAREHGVQDRVTLASFDFTTLMNTESVAPSFARVIIRRMMPADPVGLATHFGAIAILTSPASLETNPLAVEQMHDAGLGVLVYTLNSKQRWSEALALGVDGIITDKPSTLDKWLAATAPGT
ncbi:MAG: glycerophosphodiester phosphodiesterase [Microbacteriaceae bacterium]